MVWKHVGLTAVLLATAALSLPACAEPAACARDMASLLDGAVNATLKAVSGNDPDALLKLVSDEGVRFGSDGAQVTYRTLQNDFANKTGRYCDLYACDGAEGDLHHLFKDGLSDASLDEAHGLATIYINANSNDELALTFRWTDCRWELTGIAGS
jgi:hypothetical protein